MYVGLWLALVKKRKKFEHSRLFDTLINFSRKQTRNKLGRFCKVLQFFAPSPYEPWRLVELVKWDGCDVDWNVDDGSDQVQLGQGSMDDEPERQQDRL